MSETSSNSLPNLPEFTVGEISSALKRLVEDAFPLVRVKGEIGGLKFHSSGHVYFDLKDEKSVLNAVIWKGSVRSLRQRPEAGLEVVCTGRISTYAGSSRYQLIVEQVELAGVGALMAMLEARKKMLAAEGLFDAGRKRKLPFLPGTIGVVTSPTGAVIRDIMHRLRDRFPRRVLLWPVAVQGERAATEIAAAIEGFSRFPAGGLPRPDVLIVARGGGSLEDLMPFNEECVVRAVAACPIPVISAVGHETDVTLIDFAADVRAPTPTAAAEMAVPVRTELLAQVMDGERRLLSAATRLLEDRRKALAALARLLPRPDRLFANPRQRLDSASERLAYALRSNLEAYRRRYVHAAARLNPATAAGRLALAGERLEALSRRLTRAGAAGLDGRRRSLESLARLLEGVSFRAALARGFALVRGEGGRVLRSAGAVAPGMHLTLSFADGEAAATADGEKPAKTRKIPPSGGQGNLF